MKKNSEYNIVVLGVSCLDGMASSMRVRNLLEPLIKKNLIKVNNIIYKNDAADLKIYQGNINKINYSIIGFNPRNILSIVQFFYRGIIFIDKNKCSSKKNILYNYEYPDIKNILFLLYARLIGYKIVLDIVEDFRYYDRFANSLNKLKIYSSLIFIKFAPFIAHSVLAISNHLYNLMLSICKKKVSVYHIPISVDVSIHQYKAYSPPNNYKIFYGGSFGEKDGIENLIKAFDQVCLKHHNVELILTGRASDSDTKKLYCYLERSSSKEKINYKGFLSTEEYYQILGQCDIFCVPRVNSKFANAGFPFKLGEFLSLGKAVIATDVGDISKYLTNNKNAIIIKPDSIDALVNSISHILQNPQIIDALGQEGRKVAERHFDTEILSTKLFKIFTKLC